MFLQLWIQLVRMGTRSLGMHKLRSSLTVLGIVFGVASVVSILAVGEGASHAVQEQIRSLGPDRILLFSKPPQGLQASDDRLDYGLKNVDLQRIEQLIPELRSIAPSYELDKEVHIGAQTVLAPLVCTTPSFQDIHQLHLARGRFLTSTDVENRAGVVVLGAKVARELLGSEDPLGRELRIATGRYTVVGLMKPRASAGATLNDPDRSVYLPLTTGRLRLENVIRIEGAGGRRFECVELHQIGLRTANLERVDEQVAMLKRLLGDEHPLADYDMTVPFELLRQSENTKRIFSWVLGSIAGISLLVGGIGIMNIMLATVTERTREIGVRRALGAKRWHVMLQFMVETVVLSCAGGILGLGLGLLIPGLIERAAQMKTVVTPESLMLALGISVLTGVVFGMYPARRAAYMDPIEALRYG